MMFAALQSVQADIFFPQYRLLYHVV